MANAKSIRDNAAKNEAIKENYIEVIETIPTPEQIEEGTVVTDEAYMNASFMLQDIKRHILKKDYRFPFLVE